MPLAAKYAPLFFSLILAAAIPTILITLASIAGPKRPVPQKGIPFECGVDPLGAPRRRTSIKFFLIALVFLIFDVEAIFIYPWAVLFRSLGVFGFIEMTIFLLILLLGLFYIWKKGALEWE